MVRREGNAEKIAEATAEAEPRCTVPAGESPARGIAGEPGRRPPPEAERPTGEARCREPSEAKVSGGKQQRGPQHEVKPNASSQKPSQSRAEHVAAQEDGTYSETVSGTPQRGVISPRCAKVGKLVRYADDFVVLCRSRGDVEEAERRARIIFERLKLTRHSEKTRREDLTEGKEGFDFLGCHLHMRMSGKLWEEKRFRRHDCQRWPSKRSMRRVRTRVEELTDSRRNGVKDVEVLSHDLNPVLRGWGLSPRVEDADASGQPFGSGAC